MSHGYFLVYCEAGAVSTLIKLSQRDANAPTANEHIHLLHSLAELRDVLTDRELSNVRADSYLQPFLDVVQSQATIDVVTSRALLSIDKFINAGLIPSDDGAAKAVESIALTVTETKFAESDYNKADGVVFRMIEVLHSLLRAPCGCFLRYEQICKMLHCLFRVCFDTSLTPLLRMAAETALADMTRILFSRFVTYNTEDVLKSMHELLRFAVSLTNPLDTTNVEHMIVVGLNLVTVAMETSIEYISAYQNLVPLIKDDLCKCLLQLLNSSKIYVFSMANRLCYLLFMGDALRSQLKFQMETYFASLMTIIGTETASFDRKEIALESIVHLFRVPKLVSELYLNYDCGLYCSNLFEDLTKMLADNAFPTAGHILSIHLLSLSAILTVVSQICSNAVPANAPICVDYPEVVVHQSGSAPSRQQSATSSGGGSASNAQRISSISEVIRQKKQKRLITEGTELFNRSPKKGLEYLCEHGVLKMPPEPAEVAHWLRENPHLDKSRIAECICSRKNVEILQAFVESFPFEGTRLDESLRMFLESFRLPGEAAEIAKIIQQFADHWFKVNNEPFGHPDAAFTLAYAVIMLNTDQHNPTVRRNQPPMSFESFRKNLSGTNNGGDFESDMLQEVYNNIKLNEIVMPAEQTGAIRENYLWKIVQKRSDSWEGAYLAATHGCNDRDLFTVIWGPATAALSYIFDRSEEKTTLRKALTGYGNCATVAAYYGMTDVFDNLIIHLCKFSTLMGAFDVPSAGLPSAKEAGSGAGSTVSDSALGVSSRDAVAEAPDAAIYAFGRNYKAQIATRLMFELVRMHGDNLRAGWKNVVDCVLQLFRMRALPLSLTLTEDFADPRGHVCLQRPTIQKSQSRQDFLRWLGFGSTYDVQPKQPTPEEEALKKAVLTLIQDCHPEELVAGGRHLTSSALDELVNSLVHWSFWISGLDEHDASVELSTYVVVASSNSETSAPSQSAPTQVALPQTAQLQSALAQSAPPQSALAQSAPPQSAPPQSALPQSALPQSALPQNALPQSELTQSASPPSESLPSASLPPLPPPPPPPVAADSHPPPATPPTISNISRQDEDEINFLLELLLRIAVDNKYRLAHVWPLVHRHLRWTLFAFGSCLVVVERAIIAIMRITKLVIELQVADLDLLLERVVFPLLHDVLNLAAHTPEDQSATEELRVRTFQWAVRLILSHADALAASATFDAQLKRFLALAQRYRDAACTEQPRETIDHALKNMLQVLEHSKT